MATAQGTTGSTEAAIIARIVHPEKDDLPKDIARGFLRFSLDQSDLDRMHELVVKNQDDALTPTEKTELESYLRISLLVDLMHAKALSTLNKDLRVAPGVDAALERLVGDRAGSRCNIAACHRSDRVLPSRSTISHPASITAA